MKKYFVVAIAVLAMVAIAVPASAKVEFSYGGLFRARVISQNDFAYGYGNGALATSGAIDWTEESLNRFDQRTRLYFIFTASENLKFVNRLEWNEIWGNSSTSGRVGADRGDVVVKNSYLDFNIPNGAIPINAKVGIQGINLLNSWMIDDDFSSANLTFKFNDSLKASIGYIAGRNDDVFQEKDNIDDLFVVVDYVCGPWSASVVGVAQWAQDNNASADPQTLITSPIDAVNGLPAVTVQDATKHGHGSIAPIDITTPNNYFRRYLANAGGGFNRYMTSDNQLYNLGFDVRYKTENLAAYLTFIKNFGYANFVAFNADNTGRILNHMNRDFDYLGWMVDAGVNYYCGPFTLNLGGFYTTGSQDIEDSFKVNGVGQYKKTGDMHAFTYALDTTKYFSEIIGGGILDNVAPSHEDLQWHGYGMPSNLWTITAGAAWQALPTTKISFSYWYFGTAEDVVSGPKRPGDFVNQQDFLNQYFGAQNLTNKDLTFGSEIGHEFDLVISQKIVDGLMLDLVGAYLLSGEAYSLSPDDQDALELGARLQWTF